ncbi:MAG TPA: PQQ-binding-like beta-propeller repeat protein [Caulobacteraceae bacterium]|nr:PQQ-binding-like beta-propeller repeat protein [Caulobacteraceae bacterium]
MALSKSLLTTLAASAAATLAAGVALADEPDDFNQKGDILIADQFNNRVIEINEAGQIVWHWGRGPNDISAASAVGTNDALRVGAHTLISGTGVPPGLEPKCPSGCADNRVFFVNRYGKITWQYGRFGVTGSGPGQLNTPVQATWTGTHTVLITDQGNQRVIEVDPATKKILWQYGMTGVAGSGPNQLNNPNSVEVLDNGTYLIADENNNRAIVVSRGKKVLQTFTIGGTASGVAFASRLKNGDTLITDSNNNRVVEVDANDKPVWTYVTNTQPGSNPAPLPTRAIRLKNGDTIIADQVNDRVIIVDMAKNLLRQYGNLNVPGYGTDDDRQGLNWPYDAKVIGEDTGLTHLGPDPDAP